MSRDGPKAAGLTCLGRGVGAQAGAHYSIRSGLSSGQQQPHSIARVGYADSDKDTGGQRSAQGPGSLGEQV